MTDFITTSPLGSWGTFLTLLLGSVLILYLSRDSAHQAIKSLFFMLASSCRLAANAIDSSRRQMKQRNREVLLNQGSDQVARDLEKEFFEISRYVQRDLGGYPQLQREIQEKVARIEEDYRMSGTIPTQLPEWTDAVDAVAKLKSSDGSNGLNGKILDQIHKSTEQQHAELLKQHREDNIQRHKTLKNMTPYWRKLADSVDEVGNRLNEVIKRSQSIDEHMAKFNEINQGTEQAVRSLRLSSITQFIIASLVITIAIGGAFFNFHLIALPMSEMVGSVQRVSGIKVADLAALVIICLEMSAGIFLLEGLRITKLFPLISVMDDRARKTIVIAATVVLLTLACTEAALAFMRDQIAVDLANLRASLAGVEASHSIPEGVNQWIPLIANMTLGFILPLALTMIAIPLEYILQTGRHIIGGVIEILMSVIVILLKILANALRHIGKLMISIYDLYIAAPLWIEAKIKERQNRDNTNNHLDHYSTTHNFVLEKGE